MTDTSFMNRRERRRQNLIRLRDAECDGSIAALANKIGKDPSYVSRLLYEEGKPAKKNIGDSMVEAIETSFGLPRGWMDDLVAASTEGVEPSPAVTNKDVIEIPRMNANGSMGSGLMPADHEEVIERMTVNAPWLRRNVSFSAPANLALISAYGDSMEGTFNDGDILLVDRGVDNIRIDAVYVLSLNDELYIKRLQRRPDGSVLMISDNKKYEPYLIENGERSKFNVLGRVLLAWNARKL